MIQLLFLTVEWDGPIRHYMPIRHGQCEIMPFDDPDHVTSLSMLGVLMPDNVLHSIGGIIPQREGYGGWQIFSSMGAYK